MANEFIARKGLISNSNVVVSGSVGIGTVSPNASLEIVGGDILLGYGKSLQFFDSIGTARDSITFATGNWLDISGVGTNGIRIKDSNLTFDVSTYARFQDEKVLVFGSSSDFAIGYSDGEDYLQFIDGITLGTNVRMVIDNSGNVGIGTTTPNSALSVIGTISGSSNLIIDGNVGIGTTNPERNVEIYQSTTDVSALLLGNLGALGDGAVIEVHHNNNQHNDFYGMNLKIRTTKGSASNLVGFKSYIQNMGGGAATNVYGYQYADAYVSGSTVTNQFGLWLDDLDTATNNYGVYSNITPATNSFFLYDTGGAKSYFSGNVGIGTTNPNSALSVVGTISGSSNLVIDGNVGIGTASPDSPLHIVSEGTDIDLFILENHDSTSWASPEISMKRSGGTITSPTAVVENDLLGDLSAVGYDGSIYTDGSSIHFGVDDTVSAGVVPGRITFLTTDAAGSQAERMRIDSSGNVGIGTTSPGDPLVVYRATGVSTAKVQTGDTSNARFFLQNSSSWYGFILNGSDLTLDNPGGEVLRIQNNGNVGIGSASPAEKLDIDQGNIHMDQAPTSSGSATGGIVVSITVDANATGFGAALHVDTDGNLIEADASSTTTMPCFALALESGTGSKKVLTQGFVKDTSWSWTVGGAVYVSETTGAITQTAPSTTGSQVQSIGIAMASDTLYFSPDYTMIEIA